MALRKPNQALQRTRPSNAVGTRCSLAAPWERRAVYRGASGPGRRHLQGEALAPAPTALTLGATVWARGSREKRAWPPPSPGSSHSPAMEPGGRRQLEQRRLRGPREEAAEYYRGQRVPQRVEEALNALFPLCPADLYGELANYISKFSKAPVICKLVGRKVLDGVGQPTLEVEIHCMVKNHEKRICSIVMSSHSQIPENSLPDTTQADEKERNDSVNTAVEWVNESLNAMLRDLKPTDQCEVDKMLGEYFIKKVEEKKEIQKQEEKEKEQQEAEATLALTLHTPSATALPGKKKATKPGKKVSVAEKMIPPAEPVEPVLCGSFAIGGTSLAVAKAGATVCRIPLYLHIALLKHDQDSPKEMSLPLPIITLLNCEKILPAKLKLMKELMLIPPVHLSLKQGIERVLDIQKEVMRLLDPPGKVPSPQLADSKKGKAGKKAPPQVLKRISHLGCLITGFDNLEQPLLLMQTACNNIGLELGTDMYLAINCAAHGLMDYVKGKYEILTGTFKSPDEMVDMYVELINNFPFIIALIDPLRKEDREQWNNICCALGSKCYLIAEDAATHISKLKIDQNINVPMCSGVVLKYINQTKVSDLIELTGLLDGQRHITILGSPDGESSDDSLVDLVKQLLNLLLLVKNHSQKINLLLYLLPRSRIQRFQSSVSQPCRLPACLPSSQRTSH
ncbi:enolase 4 isoform X2 [Columba livia]|uniref:enolase 4 isoform X2 n=1 Tax=Columba livia TaxID=8932 RepID=UPI0031BA4C9D